MKAVGSDFFKRHHFSGLPMFANMGYGMETDNTIRQLNSVQKTFHDDMDMTNTTNKLTVVPFYN